ncbi:MAG: cation-transporting P-type ATPase, partial [Planctomycetes bacterium]|nr:cation-transporting P-type ATPase [Planctomycetota bacterium]
MKSYVPVNELQTCGRIKITKRGRVAARQIQSGEGIECEGAIDANIETEGKMKLTRLISYVSIGVRKKEGDDLLSDERELLKSAVLASESFVEEVGEGSAQEIKVHGRPIETAIAIYGLEHGLLQKELEIENKRLDLLHFESKRRFGGSINILPRSKKNRLYVSGAPEMLVDSATHIYVDGKKVLFTQAKKKQFKSAQLRSSREGKRLIGVGYKDVDCDTLPVRWEENKPDPLTENL